MAKTRITMRLARFFPRSLGRGGILDCTRTHGVRWQWRRKQLFPLQKESMDTLEHHANCKIPCLSSTNRPRPYTHHWWLRWKWERIEVHSSHKLHWIRKRERFPCVNWESLLLQDQSNLWVGHRWSSRSVKIWIYLVCGLDHNNTQTRTFHEH